MSKETCNRIQWVVLISNSINFLLIVIKFIVGFYCGAVSIISEAIHSSVDLITVFFIWWGAGGLKRKRSRKLLYSGNIQAVVIILASLGIIYTSAHEFFDPAGPERIGLGIAVMTISMAANICIAVWEEKTGKADEEATLLADAVYHRADVWSSLGVLIGLIIIWITGWQWVDPLAAIIVAVIIFKIGYSMAGDNILQDMSLPQPELMAVREVLQFHADIKGFHRVRTRKTGKFLLLDLHLVFDSKTSLAKSRKVCDRIEGELEDILGDDVFIVHAEPCSKDEHSCGH